ncbi:class I SAM-dependent methyltransferase [Photobacterium swingsii]|uniref:class I SAM-dependent methyltransferase n=1 Tax=Photobacterium swingsii TaxID=680026 RepID=UPI0040698D91
MSEEYSSEVSAHYAAYRPPLHQIILNEMVVTGDVFNIGLDIGCGTGVSTQALSQYCHHVHGVEPSAAMIAQARTTETISYHLGCGENLPIKDKSIDVVSFAGSLSYAKSDALLCELARVCKSKATVLVYDFEVQLGDVLTWLGVKTYSSNTNYDHTVNFSDCSAFHEEQVTADTINLRLTSAQLAHVLFSSIRRYVLLVEHLGGQSTFDYVREKLNAAGDTHTVSINIYYSKYKVRA